MAIKKRKKGRQKSKAAQATAQLKANREDEGRCARISSDYKGGVMTRMRGGFQSAVGQSEDKGKGSVLNTILWIAVVAAAVFFFMGQFR